LAWSIQSQPMQTSELSSHCFITVICRNDAEAHVQRCCCNRWRERVCGSGAE
jgi:hypothetical protein